MKKQPGRPRSILARTYRGKREEICNIIIYGTRAWRFIRFRKLVSGSHRPNDWIEAGPLWRELMQQFETAVVTGDDDWLNDLAKAIRGAAIPEDRAEFTVKVLKLWERKPDATAREI